MIEPQSPSALATPEGRHLSLTEANKLGSGGFAARSISLEELTLDELFALPPEKFDLIFKNQDVREIGRFSGDSQCFPLRQLAQIEVADILRLIQHPTACQLSMMGISAVTLANLPDGKLAELDNAIETSNNLDTPQIRAILAEGTSAKRFIGNKEITSRVR